MLIKNERHEPVAPAPLSPRTTVDLLLVNGVSLALSSLFLWDRVPAIAASSLALGALAVGLAIHLFIGKNDAPVSTPTE